MLPLESGLLGLDPAPSAAAVAALRTLDAVLDGTHGRRPRAAAAGDGVLPPLPDDADSAAADLAVAGMVGASAGLGGIGGGLGPTWSPLVLALSLAPPPAVPAPLWGAAALHPEDGALLLGASPASPEGGALWAEEEGAAALAEPLMGGAEEGAFVPPSGAAAALLAKGAEPQPTDFDEDCAAMGGALVAPPHAPPLLSCADTRWAHYLAAAAPEGGLPPALRTLVEAEGARLRASPAHFPLAHADGAGSAAPGWRGPLPGARAAAAALALLAANLPLLPQGTSQAVVGALGALLRLHTTGIRSGAEGAGSDGGGFAEDAGGGETGAAGFRLAGRSVGGTEAAVLARNAAATLLAALAPLAPASVCASAAAAAEAAAAAAAAPGNGAAAAAAAAAAAVGDAEGEGAALAPWFLAIRGALGVGLVSPLPAVRRACCAALGQYARVGGAPFSRRLLASLARRLRAEGAHPLPGAAKAGYAVAVAAVLRAGAGEMRRALVGGAAAAAALRAPGGAPAARAAAAALLEPPPPGAAAPLPPPDGASELLFEAARDTKPPARAWALHALCALLGEELALARALMAGGPPAAAAAAAAALATRLAPALALLEAHGACAPAEAGAGPPSLFDGVAVAATHRVALGGGGGAGAEVVGARRRRRRDRAAARGGGGGGGGGGGAPSGPPLPPCAGAFPASHAGTAAFASACVPANGWLPGGGGVAYGDRLGGLGALGDACDALLWLLAVAAARGGGGGAAGEVTPLLLLPVFEPTTGDVLPAPGSAGARVHGAHHRALAAVGGAPAARAAASASAASMEQERRLSVDAHAVLLASADDGAAVALACARLTHVVASALALLAPPAWAALAAGGGGAPLPAHEALVERAVWVLAGAAAACPGSAHAAPAARTAAQLLGAACALARAAGAPPFADALAAAAAGGAPPAPSVRAGAPPALALASERLGLLRCGGGARWWWSCGSRACAPAALAAGLATGAVRVWGGARGGSGLLASAVVPEEEPPWCAAGALACAAAAGDAPAAVLIRGAVDGRAPRDVLAAVDALLARGGSLPRRLASRVGDVLLPPPPALPPAPALSCAPGGAHVGAHGRALLAGAAAERVAAWAAACARPDDAALAALGALLEAACALAEAAGGGGGGEAEEEEEEGAGGGGTAPPASPLAHAALRLLGALLAAGRELRDPLAPADHLFAQHSALLTSALGTLAGVPALCSEAADAIAGALACGAVHGAGAARRLLPLALCAPARGGENGGCATAALLAWAAPATSPARAEALALLLRAAPGRASAWAAALAARCGEADVLASAARPALLHAPLAAAGAAAALLHAPAAARLSRAASLLAAVSPAHPAAPALAAAALWRRAPGDGAAAAATLLGAAAASDGGALVVPAALRALAHALPLLARADAAAAAAEVVAWARTNSAAWAGALGEFDAGDREALNGALRAAAEGARPQQPAAGAAPAAKEGAAPAPLPKKPAFNIASFKAKAAAAATPKGPAVDLRAFSQLELKKGGDEEEEDE